MAVNGISLRQLHLSASLKKDSISSSLILKRLSIMYIGLVSGIVANPHINLSFFKILFIKKLQKRGAEREDLYSKSPSALSYKPVYSPPSPLHLVFFNESICLWIRPSSHILPQPVMLFGRDTVTMPEGGKDSRIVDPGKHDDPRPFSSVEMRGVKQLRRRKILYLHNNS